MDNHTKYLVLDYETRSRADLPRVGAAEYARHPSTEILCVAWRYGTRAELPKVKTETWSPALGKAPITLFTCLEWSDRLVAHNALFEQLITEHVLPKYIPKRYAARNLLRSPSGWLCTAALAAALALPRKLEGATAVLKLKHQKDMVGHKLMMKMSKPRKPTKDNPAKWHSKKKDLFRLMEYCARDVDAEVDLLLTLPPLTATERQVWELDQRTNLRGVAVDRAAIEKIMTLVDEEAKALDAEVRSITGGEVESASKVQQLRRAIIARGCPLPNMQAKTIRDTLAMHLTPEARRLLEIRTAASKTSTAKYVAMEARSRSDGRVRDLMMYHGASTGRWTGTGVQLQNFPRGVLNGEDGRPLCTAQAIEIIKSGDLDLVRMLYGEPMDAFSSVLRSIITASPGFEIFCGDYASIEVRVLFWLAEHTDGVRAYREDRKIYEEMAAVAYGVPLERVTKAMREVGKRIILGCGYSMGHKKFRETCIQYGVPMDEALAKRSVDAYRSAHHPVPAMWYAVEDAAIRATLSPGRVFATNKTRWFVKNNFLWCELPSKRRLAFYGPEIKQKQTPWGEPRNTLYHFGVHPKTKQWTLDHTYGGRLVENITQAVARDIMAEASLRLDRAGYPLLFSVHDELVNEKEIGRGSLEEYTGIMGMVPEWAEGLPLKVEAWSGSRYRK